MSKKITYRCDVCGKEIDAYGRGVPYWMRTYGGRHKCHDCAGKPYPDDVICRCGHYKFSDHYPVMGGNLSCEVCDCEEFIPVEEKN